MPVTEKQQEAYEAEQRYSTRKEAARALDITPKALRKRLKGYYRNSGDNGDDGAGPKVSPLDGGFDLEGANVLAEKPTDIWKARFFALTPGKGYHIEYLADQWGNSIDTIRSKAKRFGSLRYIEDRNRPGNYMACVVHPSTPKGK